MTHDSSMSMQPANRQYPHVQSFRSSKASATLYHYHRPTRTRLPGEPGSEEFDRAYQEACAKWEANGEAPAKARTVYFVQGEVTGMIKIGMTRNLENRLRKIVTDCSEPVRVLGQFVHNYPGIAEAEMHRRFAKAHSHGEWFRPDPELLDHIRNVSSKTCCQPDP